ncbi:MAG TPA: HAD family hydrolase [Candidatus Saccharibacteria bacterium]|nr:HAD family hydrolase [Candidatus Saccharibacteria bacterium]
MLVDKYDYFLFDWDGCLAKTLEAWLDAYRHTFALYGKTPSDAEIAHYLGDYLIGSYFGVEDAEQFNIQTVDYARENLKTVDLYEDALDTLTELKKIKKLALVSSGSKDIVYTGLRHNSIEHLFDIIITGDDVENHKPHPEALEIAMAHIGGIKEKAIMIGDSNKDIGAATNYGIDSVLVFPQSHSLFYDLQSLQDLKPTYTITSFTEFSAQPLQPQP